MLPEGLSMGAAKFCPLPMSETHNVGESHEWPKRDMEFATNQLSREFPTVPPDRVTMAVNSAAPFVTLADGRVELMRRAREFLHRDG
jgi:hypothetical protein